MWWVDLLLAVGLTDGTVYKILSIHLTKIRQTEAVPESPICQTYPPFAECTRKAAGINLLDQSDRKSLPDFLIVGEYYTDTPDVEI
jgi:hypothetical protein